MGRRTFDVLVSMTGLMLAVLLLVGGGLLTWGSSYVNGEVSDQLSAQNIVFPPADSEEVADDRYASVRQYGGQELTTGAQAKVYADDFIGAHLEGIGGGKTYSELSDEAMADPDNEELAGQVDSMFRGETLRGLLLNAYAFDRMAMIMRVSSIVAFVAAGLLLLLSVLGFLNVRRVPPGKQLLEPRPGAEDYGRSSPA